MKLLALLLLAPTVLSVQTQFALIKGTVFTPEGRSYRGATITVVRSGVDEKQVKKSRKETVSDGLGEFAFRLESGPAKYRITVEAKGFPTQERDVEIAGDE